MRGGRECRGFGQNVEQAWGSSLERRCEMRPPRDSRERIDGMRERLASWLVRTFERIARRRDVPWDGHRAEAWRFDPRYAARTHPGRAVASPPLGPSPRRCARAESEARDRRPTIGPRSSVFEWPYEPKQEILASVRGNELQSDRQAHVAPEQGHRNRGLARHGGRDWEAHVRPENVEARIRPPSFDASDVAVRVHGRLGCDALPLARR